MASHVDDLNFKERLRWGSPIKVYTRKRRRNQKNEDPITTVTAAAPEINEDGDKNGGRPSSEALEVGEPKSGDELQNRQEEAAEFQLGDSSPRNLGLEDGRDGDQVEEAAEFQLGDSLPRNLGLEDGRDGDQVELIDGGQGQEDPLGSQADLEGRDVAEGGGCPSVEPNNGGEVGGEEAAIASYRGGSTRGHVEPDARVKPVISRVQDRVRINIAGATSRNEIRNIRRELKGELDQIRSLAMKLEAKELQVKELQAKELQLTRHNTSTNVGRITATPSGAVNAYSQPQYLDNGVMNSRSLVRVNSEVGLVGHPGSRPFQRPRVAAVENNNGGAECVEKEKRTPKANQYYTNSEFLLGKDRLPLESNRKIKSNGGGRKHNGEAEQGYPFGFGFDKHRNQVFKRCTSLLQRLMKHKHGWVFNEPVNVEALRLHDYHDIIKHPMDLGTIKAKLSRNFYKSPREFAEDVRLVFRNAMTYNPKGHDVHVMSEQLLKIFEDKWAVIEADFNPDWRYQMYHDAGLPAPPSRKAPRHSPFARASHAAPPASRARTLDRSQSMTGPADFRFKPSRTAHVGRIPVPKKPKANDPNKRDMTYEEKQRLSTHLQNLPTEKLDAVVQIIKRRNLAFNQHGEEIEIDIDIVDVETLWELDRFVTNYKKNLSKQKRKTELALQARGTARTAPVMNSAPMVTGALNSNTGENNTTALATNAEAGRLMDNASRSSSSSSSSSDSGSSSSDSDSDSSSGSGSEAGR